MLIPNLKSNGNTEARVKVLSDNITPKRLCFVTDEEFITIAEKKSRHAARDRYLKSHIVTMSTLEEYQTMIKTHKGMAVIEIEQAIPIEKHENLLTNNFHRQKKTVKMIKDNIRITSERGTSIQKGYLNNPNKVFLSKYLKDQLIFYSGKQMLNDFEYRHQKHLPK